MRAQRKRAPKFSLKSLTCEELYNIVTNEPTGPEAKQLKGIRSYFKGQPHKLPLLKLCRSLKATYFKAYIRTAANLECVPEIALMIGGGQPKQPEMPPWSVSLKKIGELNGMVIHRWGKGAFRMKQR